MIKIADRKIEKLGFKKIQDDKYGARYHRYNETYGYTHEVAIIHKESGKHILQSYDVESSTSKGSINVGLTYTELKWFKRKMKEIGLVDKENE